MAQATIPAVLNTIAEKAIAAAVTTKTTPTPAVTKLDGTPTLFPSDTVVDYTNGKIKFNYLIVQYYNDGLLTTVSGTTPWLVTTGICDAAEPTVAATAASNIDGTDISFDIAVNVTYSSCTSQILDVYYEKA